MTGADLDGSSVDQTCYVDAEGAGVSLVRGSYSAAIAASLISSDGTIAHLIARDWGGRGRFRVAHASF
ncbi:MAG: hypothetical protein WAY93_03475 [Atopobiaceae bacterium]|nr:hypothetical protein [Atopobiaceae bacterium]